MTLEGWVPQLNDYTSLHEVVDFAFDYRGNTTVVKTDGSEVVGYIFNRNADVPEPFVQLFDEQGDGPMSILYRDIATIKFTGKDTAAGNSPSTAVRAVIIMGRTRFSAPCIMASSSEAPAERRRLK